MTIQPSRQKKQRAFHVKGLQVLLQAQVIFLGQASPIPFPVTHLSGHGTDSSAKERIKTVSYLPLLSWSGYRFCWGSTALFLISYWNGRLAMVTELNLTSMYFPMLLQPFNFLGIQCISDIILGIRILFSMDYPNLENFGYTRVRHNRVWVT